MMVWNSWKVSGEQYDKAIERCATKEKPAACVVAVQEHHDECLDKALTRGGRFDGEHFNVHVYDDCVLGVGQDEDDPASSVE